MADDNIRMLPEQAERVESGAVQFGNDWPGIFLRGDNTFGFLLAMKSFLDKTPEEMKKSFEYLTIKGYMQLFSECIIGSTGEAMRKEFDK